jgi:hypothetical protein
MFATSRYKIPSTRFTTPILRASPSDSRKNLIHSEISLQTPPNLSSAVGACSRSSQRSGWRLICVLYLLHTVGIVKTVECCYKGPGKLLRSCMYVRRRSGDSGLIDGVGGGCVDVGRQGKAGC